MKDQDKRWCASTMRCADCSRVYGHQLLLLFVRASLRGHREEGGLKRAGRGAQEGCTYSQRTQLEAQHARRRGAPLAHVVLDLRGAQATAGEHEMGCAWWARAGQGWRMGSSGRVSRSMAAASPANGREQGCEAEGVGGRRARGRIAWRERCGSGGFREQQASRRSMRAARGGR